MTTLRAATPLHVAGHTVIAVERVWLHTHEPTPWAAAGREPVAVVIRDGDGTRAVDVTGKALDLDGLLDTVDGLAAALTSP